MSEIGTLSILNVYEGDVKITFDKEKPSQVEKARKTILDCIRRGYTILVEVNGGYMRAIDFDAEVGEYLIPNIDSLQDLQEPQDAQKQKTSTGKKENGPRRRIKMESTNAVAVARSAGG